MKESQPNGDAMFSLAQQQALVLAPILPSLLSMFGSASIAVIILRDWRKKLARVYHRTLLGFYLLDSASLSALMAPKDTLGGYYMACLLTS